MEREPVSAISLRHILASPGYAPGTIAVNVSWMKKRIQSLSNASQHVPANLQPFMIYSDGRKLQLFPIPLALNAPVGSVPIGIPG